MINTEFSNFAFGYRKQARNKAIVLGDIKFLLHHKTGRLLRIATQTNLIHVTRITRCLFQRMITRTHAQTHTHSYRLNADHNSVLDMKTFFN